MSETTCLLALPDNVRALAAANQMREAQEAFDVWVAGLPHQVCFVAELFKQGSDPWYIAKAIDLYRRACLSDYRHYRGMMLHNQRPAHVRNGEDIVRWAGETLFFAKH